VDRAPRSEEGLSVPAYRVVVVGWHGSRERHLRVIARHHESAGADVMIVVPRTFDAMAFPGGWEREGARLARELLARHRAEPRPLVLHGFSNAGFWTLRALLDALDPDARAALRATVLDSAPGFPEHVSPLFTARFASRAMLPGVLAALRLRPAHRHPLVTPPVAAFLGAWHLISPRQVRFMESSLARMCEHHRGIPMLIVYGDRDELVLPQYVEAFLARAEREGVRAEHLHLADGAHVRHLVTHRHAYLARLDAFLTRSLAPV
jgi:fermentation-respiration switch protein FrsA (DUF1100 family)